MSKTIGIDLGTTNSCVSVIDGGKPVIIPSYNGKNTTPSVVAFTTKGERLIGESALRQMITNPERTIASIKREMGTDWHKNIDGKTFIPQEISAMILRQLKKDAEKYLGEEVVDAVITVPAYFNDIQRQATKDAGTIAGLNVKRIINEPTSAALAYGLNHGTPQKIMVFDLGGGTFDVSIIEIGEGVIEVLATAGDNHLGGDDFDEIITNWIMNEFKKTNRIDLKSDLGAYQRVKDAAEKAKIELSSSEITTISLPFIYNYHGEVLNLEMNLTRKQFNELTKELVSRTAIPVEKALNDASIAKSELGKVILVGGSTRIPAVQQKVYELTGMQPSKDINPDECVAQGAAIQADTLSGGNLMIAGASNGLLLLDVTPLSLSIETVGGVATRLVERNSTLPIHYSRIFSTAQNYQSLVEINVLQGERPMARDNKSIGRFKLKGIKKALAGVPQIEVTFDIDANGILKVSARDLDTGNEQSIVIESSGKMSTSEIQQAINDAKQFEQLDEVRKKTMELLSESSKLMNEVDKFLKESKKQLDKNLKKELKTKKENLQKLVFKIKPLTVTEDEYDSLKENYQILQQTFDDIGR